MKYRVLVLHGVNMDMLGMRDPNHYGRMTLTAIEFRVKRYAHEMGLDASFAQTNHEGEYCEFLHRASETSDGLVLNPGAWTHYSYAMRDALEIANLPSVEVHLSAVSDREEWRRQSVISDICLGSVEGKGVEGYREALLLLEGALHR